MKRIFSLVASLIFFQFLFGSNTSSTPRTVDEAVTELKTKWLSKEKLDWVLRNPKETVVADLHLPFGTEVRNEWGLWKKDSALLRSCGVSHPEDCSGIIFEKLWDSVRKDASANLVQQLDCQFQLASLIKVSYRGYYKLKMGQLLEDLQRQINDQIVDASFQLPNVCGSNLKLILQGNPDPSCWSRIEFSEDGRDPVNLNLFLGWVSWRNAFEIRHSPPNIDLIFTQACAWPTFPKHFLPEN
jgi:hypothetical protein